MIFPTTGPLPWSSSPYSYAGWIPTITGHLSFSLIGGPRISPRCQYFNEQRPVGADRLVAVHQHRTTLDYIIPPGAIQLAKKAARQDYLLVARTGPADTPYFYGGDLKQTPDEHGVLSGNIFVIPRDRNPIIEKRRKDLLKDLQRLLGPPPKPQPDDTPEIISDRLEAIFDAINTRVRNARLEGIACLAMNVALFRTGEVRIWYDLKHFLGREVHSQAIRPTKLEVALADCLAPQTYFFIKDITHQHYHHEPDSDQLLPLIRLKPVRDTDDHDKNELHWRRQTLWGLARVVSQFRRSNTLYDLKKAMGVLAYADAFQSTLALIWRRPMLDDHMVPHQQLSRYDFAHTRSSVEALEGLAAWRRSGWLQIFAIMVGVVLSSLALWAGAIQIWPIVCVGPPGANGIPTQLCETFSHHRIVGAVDWVAWNPIPFTLGIFVLGFAAFVLVFRDISFLPFGKHLHRALGRVSKAIGASISRSVGQDSMAADWLGFVSSLAVPAAGFVASLLFAANSGHVGTWVATLLSWLLGFLGT